MSAMFSNIMLSILLIIIILNLFFPLTEWRIDLKCICKHQNQSSTVFRSSSNLTLKVPFLLV